MRTGVLGLVIVLVGQAGGFAQLASRIASGQPTISISVFVTDARGNPATSIGDTDLLIEDEQQPRDVIRVTHDTTPLRLGVVIDRSNSQRASDLYKSGLHELNMFLTQVLREESDEVFIEVFDTAPDRPLPWMARNELGQVQLNARPGGGSSLFDSIDLACKERFGDSESPSRRVLILLTDGEDNQSRINLDDAITAAQRAKAAVFAVSTRENQNGYGRNDSERAADTVLRKLADSTGGYAFLELGPKQISKAFLQIVAQLDSIFDLVFIPTPAANREQPHTLAVRSASGSKLRVHAAKRYYATIQ